MKASLEQMHPLLYPLDNSGGETALLPWLIAAGILLVPAGYWLWRRRRGTPRQKTLSAPQTVEEQLLSALAELQQLPAPAPGEQAGPWLQQLNQLLKRFCAVRYPDLHGHRLTGRDWLAFLDSRCPAAGLTRWLVLVEGSYQPDCRLEQSTIEGVSQAVHLWMHKHV